MAEFCVVVANVGRNRELQLGNLLPIRIEEWLIHLASHMEDDVLVGSVCVVMVTEPIAGFLMNLHVAYPFDTIQLDFRPCEVRSSISIVDAGVEHLHQPAVRRTKFVQRENLMLPCVMQQLFHCFLY